MYYNTYNKLKYRIHLFTFNSQLKLNEISTKRCDPTHCAINILLIYINILYYVSCYHIVNWELFQSESFKKEAFDFFLFFYWTRTSEKQTTRQRKLFDSNASLFCRFVFILTYPLIFGQQYITITLNYKICICDNPRYKYRTWKKVKVSRDFWAQVYARAYVHSGLLQTTISRQPLDI